MLAHLVVAILLLGGFFLIYCMGKKHSQAQAEKDNRIKELEWEVGRLTRLLEKHREPSEREAKMSELAPRPPTASSTPHFVSREPSDPYVVTADYRAGQWKLEWRRFHRHRPPVVSPTLDRGTALLPEDDYWFLLPEDDYWFLLPEDDYRLSSRSFSLYRTEPKKPANTADQPRDVASS